MQFHIVPTLSADKSKYWDLAQYPVASKPTMVQTPRDHRAEMKVMMTAAVHLPRDQGTATTTAMTTTTATTDRRGKRPHAILCNRSPQCRDLLPFTNDCIWRVVAGLIFGALSSLIDDSYQTNLEPNVESFLRDPNHILRRHQRIAAPLRGLEIVLRSTQQGWKSSYVDLLQFTNTIT